MGGQKGEQAFSSLVGFEVLCELRFIVGKSRDREQLEATGRTVAQLQHLPMNRKLWHNVAA
ncbi:hypothetical protein HCU01_42810 [Halomonas cupida]|uniref:Transposase, Mutator family n=1 Tax=Halomonas cupida TaxID=44933 RepID=A0ABQ0WNG1_9GAMM|nr:hypothetical protein HCU01_42810 [Halomonas cupida]